MSFRRILIRKYSALDVRGEIVVAPEDPGDDPEVDNADVDGLAIAFLVRLFVKAENAAAEREQQMDEEAFGSSSSGGSFEPKMLLLRPCLLGRFLLLQQQLASQPRERATGEEKGRRL